MDVSIITGSRSVADNVTSLYTFVIGIIAGGFLAIGLGDVDMEAGLRGDLLRMYLAVLTAVLAGLGALLISRIGDRISDRRSRVRKIGNNLLRIRMLESELTTAADHLRQMLGKGITPTTANSQQILIAFIGLERIKHRAGILPDFLDLIETKDDEDRALRVVGTFHFLSELEPHGPFTAATFNERKEDFAEFIDQYWVSAFKGHAETLGREAGYLDRHRR